MPRGSGRDRNPVLGSREEKERWEKGGRSQSWKRKETEERRKRSPFKISVGNNTLENKANSIGETPENRVRTKRNSFKEQIFQLSRRKYFPVLRAKVRYVIWC